MFIAERAKKLQNRGKSEIEHSKTSMDTGRHNSQMRHIYREIVRFLMLSSKSQIFCVDFKRPPIYKSNISVPFYLEFAFKHIQFLQQSHGTLENNTSFRSTFKHGCFVCL